MQAEYLKRSWVFGQPHLADAEHVRNVVVLLPHVIHKLFVSVAHLSTNVTHRRKLDRLRRLKQEKGEINDQAQSETRVHRR